MSQYKSRPKPLIQNQNQCVHASLQEETLNLVRFNENQRAGGNEAHGSIGAVTTQDATAHTSICKPNQDFTIKLGSCEEMLGNSPWSRCFQKAPAQQAAFEVADRSSILSFSTSSLLPPLRLRQRGALEDPDAASRGGGSCGAWHIPVFGTDASNECGARFRAPSLAPVSELAALPPPADDPFHGDWPHW
jgi:hypothetical protein